MIKTVALCRKYGAPVTSRGGGTSLAGQACNVAVIIDMSKYLTRVLAIDPVQRTARVEPGCILDDLRDEARAHMPHLRSRSRHPQSQHARRDDRQQFVRRALGDVPVHHGPGPLPRHQVIELDVLTYDGERFTIGVTSDTQSTNGLSPLAAGAVLSNEETARAAPSYHAAEIRERFVNIPRRVSGYNLDALLPEHDFNVAHALVGTEGTCAIVLGATITLIPDKPARALLVLGYPDAYQAADHVPEIMAHQPVGLEGFDGVLVEMMRKRQWHPDQVAMLPAGDGWLLVEFGGESPRGCRCARRAG